MPEQVLRTHVSGQRERQLVMDMVDSFEPVRESVSIAEDAKVDVLRERYRWGLKLREAVEESDSTDTSFYLDIAEKLSKSKSYVAQHKRFADSCLEEFSMFNPEVDGYIADCQDAGRSFAWRAAIAWMSNSQGGQAKKEEEEYDAWQEMKEVENAIERLDEASDRFSRSYMKQKDSLNENERRQFEGVLVKAKQVLEDERQMVEKVPDRNRVVCEPYRRWVADHACCNCGVMDDTIVPHHPKEWYGKSGMGTKISDFLTVPLCFECHEEAEDNREFWNESPTTPPDVTSRLQADFLERAITE